jgi:hypothetical protein
MINFDLETTPLQIKTDSTIGSDDMLYVKFCTSQGYHAGAVKIWFRSPQYLLDGCTDFMGTNFPKDLPTATDKIWTITKTRTSGTRIQIHCNNVEVVNILISKSTCSEQRDYELQKWNNNVARIQFTSYDEASDNYRPKKIG